MLFVARVLSACQDRFVPHGYLEMVDLFLEGLKPFNDVFKIFKLGAGGDNQRVFVVLVPGLGL